MRRYGRVRREWLLRSADRLPVCADTDRTSAITSFELLDVGESRLSKAFAFICRTV